MATVHSAVPSRNQAFAGVGFENQPQRVSTAAPESGDSAGRAAATTAMIITVSKAKARRIVISNLPGETAQLTAFAPTRLTGSRETGAHLQFCRTDVSAQFKLP